MVVLEAAAVVAYIALEVNDVLTVVVEEVIETLATVVVTLQK